MIPNPCRGTRHCPKPGEPCRRCGLLLCPAHVVETVCGKSGRHRMEGSPEAASERRQIAAGPVDVAQPVSTRHDEEIRRRRSSDPPETIQSIAHALGIAFATVHKVMVRLGLPSRQRKDVAAPVKRRPRASADRDALLVKLAAEGKSQTEIARAVGMTGSGVRLAAERLGVTLTPVRSRRVA